MVEGGLRKPTLCRVGVARPRAGLGCAGRGRGGVVTRARAQGEETVAEAVQRLTESDARRLWVVGGDGEPVDVVTLSDVLRIIASA